MALIKMYKGTVTAGGTDGVEVSAAGNYSSPIQFTLDATTNEAKTVALALRCDSGYVTTGTVTISEEGDTHNRVGLCWTENGTFGNSLTTEDAIGATNTLFYVRASSASSETPQVDRSISLRVSCGLMTT